MAKKMKKNTIDNNELIECIERIQKQYPPSSEKNITMAFQAFIGEGFEEIITYQQWLNIYKPNKAAKAIAGEILITPNIKRSVFHYGMGMGGQRGLSKAWIPCLNAEQILFDPKSVIRDFKLKIERPSDFHFLIKQHSRDESLNEYDFKTGNLLGQYDERTKKILTLCVHWLCSVYEKFIKAYNPKEKKYGQAITLLLGKNHPWATENIGRGKRVTYQNVNASINEFREHIKHRKPINSRAYTDKKFYYLTYLVSFCFLCIDFDPERTRAIEEISRILSPFTPADRLKIANEAAKKKNFEEETLNSVFGKNK